MAGIQGFTVDNIKDENECIPGRHLKATFGVRNFVTGSMEPKWPPSKFIFPVIYIDFYLWNDPYMSGVARDGASMACFIEHNIPELAARYYTEAVYLPLAPSVIAALKREEAIAALDRCGLEERVLVDMPESNLLYMACLMCNRICNQHAPDHEIKDPLNQLEKCLEGEDKTHGLGADKRFKWVVLQKSVTNYGVDLSSGVRNPKRQE